MPKDLTDYQRGTSKNFSTGALNQTEGDPNFLKRGD